MPFKIVRNDITKMNTQAIVNTANEFITVGTGCDRAIYTAAGFDELLSYRKEKIGEVPEGEVFITPGFNLSAEYIIHAVSPMYINGDESEEEKLRSCYRKSLQLAADHSIKSIAFPLISTGGFGYPKEEGMRIAIDEISAFLQNNDMLIYLVVFDSKTAALGSNIYPELEEYIDQNYVVEKRKQEYSEDYNSSFNDIPETGSKKTLRSIFKRASKESTKGLSRKSSKGTQRNSEAFREDFSLAEEDYEECSEVEENADFYDEDRDSSNLLGASPCSMEISPKYIPFDEKYEDKLSERMKHLSDTFSEYLLYLIKDKKMENADVYKRAIVDKKTFSKIKNNKDYHPQKLTALCLCIGAKLNLDETIDLLARAGYALSPCDKTDIIFSFFIENEIYDMIELDIQLEEHGLPCVIS